MGSYYDHAVKVVETSLNNFLADTTFPYTPSSSGGMGGGAPGVVGSRPELRVAARCPRVRCPPAGPSPSGGATTQPASTAASVTYTTVQEYIDHLNGSTSWVAYDASTKTAKISSLGAFVASQKTASKDVGAFDGIDRAATENVVLGLNTAGLHFAGISKDVLAANEATYAKLTGWKTTYASSEYASDFAKTDSIGKDVTVRSNMYNPMYYLSCGYEGFKTSTVAKHWRIRTGITQGDTGNTTAINLALALGSLGSHVHFATVWGQGHTTAERTGDSSTNFTAWVKDAVAMS